MPAGGIYYHLDNFVEPRSQFRRSTADLSATDASRRMTGPSAKACSAGPSSDTPSAAAQVHFLCDPSASGLLLPRGDTPRTDLVRMHKEKPRCASSDDHLFGARCSRSSWV